MIYATADSFLEEESSTQSIKIWSMSCKVPDVVEITSKQVKATFLGYSSYHYLASAKTIKFNEASLFT